jgi:hypothetical protein
LAQGKAFFAAVRRALMLPAEGSEGSLRMRTQNIP